MNGHNAPDEPGSRSAAVDWLFADRETGEITIAQAPNPPLWIFIGTVVAGWFVSSDGSAYEAIRWIGTGALAWWALSEVVAGVNPWRRLLGIGGVALVLLRVVALVS